MFPSFLKGTPFYHLKTAHGGQCYKVAGGCSLQAALPLLKAVSPASLFVRISLAVLNSSPMNPSLKSHVLIAYFGFSVCCGFGLAVLTYFAIWLKAKQSWM